MKKNFLLLCSHPRGIHRTEVAFNIHQNWRLTIVVVFNVIYAEEFIIAELIVKVLNK